MLNGERPNKSNTF